MGNVLQESDPLLDSKASKKLEMDLWVGGPRTGTATLQVEKLQ